MVTSIQLTKGRTALIDDQDYELVNQFNWVYLDNGRRGYAINTYQRVTRLMHRLILDAPSGVCVDHIDGDGLNNTRANLRLCSHAQNIRNQEIHRDNSSGFKGVTWDSRNYMWKARIECDGKSHFLGLFIDVLDAAAAYNKAALALHGDFAKLNVIPSRRHFTHTKSPLPKFGGQAP